MKTYLFQSGITENNKPIISGIYKTFETHGIPLDIILSILIDGNSVPNWIDLYKDCRLAGMEHDRVLSKLEEAICDSYGKEWSDQVIFRLNSIFKTQEKL